MTPADPRLLDLCATLTLEEKVSLLTGRDFWSTRAIERIGLLPIVFSDGPSGIRGEVWDERDPSLNLPSASALSASWDLEVARRYGAVLADEAQRKGIDVVLGPTINLQRSPTGGRHFEAYSEDPLLTAELAAAYVAGVQEHGIGAAPKHYVCNDFETERYTADVIVSERALREVYLFAFEKAVTKARAWLVMSAYNAINGPTASENPLLESPLNDEWGFDGVMIGDWTGVRSLESARFSQDLAMPGPDGPWGAALVAAVRSGDIAESVVDRKVVRILALAARVGALKGFEPAAGRRTSGIDGTAFARDAAVAGSVLLRNDGLLPIAPQSVSQVVVIGHGARHPRTQGGGSATVVPDHVVTPLDGLRCAFPGAQVDHLPGVLVENGLAELALDRLENPATGGQGVRVRFLDDDVELHAEDRRSSNLVWFGGDAPIDRSSTLEITTVYSPDIDGVVNLGVATVGHTRVYVDDRLLLDETIEPIGTDLGAALLAPPAISTSLPVTNGESRRLRIVLDVPRKSEGLTNALGISFGLLPPQIDDDTLIADAVCSARDADLAVVVVGSNKELEAEGADRETLALPGRQDDLVRAVAAVNPRTLVVVNCGAPVLLPWADEVGAVLLPWFGGQELGHAIADIVTGEKEPGGRLPMTWPARESDVPVLHVEPVAGKVHYDEDVHVGYRGWLRRGTTPAFTFGFGLGYTSWSLSHLMAPPTIKTRDADARITVSVGIQNVGARRGKQVVQLYASRTDTSIDRPRTWLIGFAPVEVDAGRQTTIEIPVDVRAFAHFDRGWQWEPGAFTVHAGTSLGDLPLKTTVMVRGQ